VIRYLLAKSERTKDGANLSAPNTASRRITWTTKSIERSDAYSLDSAGSEELSSQGTALNLAYLSAVLRHSNGHCKRTRLYRPNLHTRFSKMQFAEWTYFARYSRDKAATVFPSLSEKRVLKDIALLNFTCSYFHALLCSW